MSPLLQWPDLLLRLVVTIAAGAVIGANRVEQAKPAGLRTTILVALAASTSMLLANLLLETNGRPADSYVHFDVMRLPLGILTGVGFIGGGTILRRHDLVIGITTAATLWLATVIGLCIGAGNIALGVAVTALGFATLAGLGVVEKRIPQDRRGRLSVTSDGDGQMQDALLTQLREAGFVVANLGMSITENGCEARFDLRWRGLPTDATPPVVVPELARRPEIRAVHWEVVVR